MSDNKKSLETRIDEDDFILGLTKAKQYIVNEINNLNSQYNDIVNTFDDIGALIGQGYRIKYFYNKEDNAYTYSYHKKSIGFKKED